jgi:hypothetical protein
MDALPTKVAFWTAIFRDGRVAAGLDLQFVFQGLPLASPKLRAHCRECEEEEVEFWFAQVLFVTGAAYPPYDSKRTKIIVLRGKLSKTFIGLFNWRMAALTGLSCD